MQHPDHAINDRRLIEGLIYRWALARDSDDWASLSECFHDDGEISISWIRATAETFIGRSKEMAGNRKPGVHMKHLITNNWIQVNGDRGFSRCNAVLLIRDHVDGNWFDFEGHFRFFDRLEKRNNNWGIVNRTAVYDKDQINDLSPTDTKSEKQSRPWDDDVLATFPQEAKYLFWWFANKGITCDPELITAYSPAEKRLHANCLAWLNQAS